MSRWYRAYSGTCTDAKLHEAAMVAGVSRSVAIAAWHCLLEACADAKSGEHGITARRVAVILGEPLKDVEALFAAFDEIGVTSEGVVLAWRMHEAIDFRLSAEWRSIREFVFKRDDYTCNYCGSRGVSLQCDHVIPVAKGGSHCIENLVTACRKCNQSKRDKMISEWRQ